MFPVATVAIVIAIVYLLSSIKILAEHERGVIFRLGRMLEHARGPGIILVLAPMERIVRVSLREGEAKTPLSDALVRDRASHFVDWIGIAQTALSPAGKVLVRGEMRDAVAPVNVPSGERVIVRRSDGLILRVEPLALPRPEMTHSQT